MTEYFYRHFTGCGVAKRFQIDAVIGVGGTMRTIGKYERAKMALSSCLFRIIIH